MTGVRYVRGAPVVRCVLVRTGAFSLARECAAGAAADAGASPWRDRIRGAAGVFWIGALAGAAVLPRLRSRFSVDGVVACAIVVFAAMTFRCGTGQTFAMAGW